MSTGRLIFNPLYDICTLGGHYGEDNYIERSIKFSKE